MTTVTQITLNQKNTRLVVLLAMLLLSSVGMFGQEVATVSSTVITTEIVADETAATTTATAVESNSNINIVSWFMGTKQTPKTNAADGAMNSKKQMINSGIAPNRLLIKTFLKKASSFQVAVA